jgi:hypothetical protein
MSIWHNSGNATLGEIIDYLRTLPPDMIVERGFDHPHSYRGYYEDLAFEPALNVTVKQMLAAAEYANGHTYEGYKGGDYVMDRETDCWLANYGDCGVPIVIPGKQKVYELPQSADAVDPHADIRER